MIKIANRAWLYGTGIVIGAAGIVLAAFGNPGNMGICAACFIRDTAGALGFDSLTTVQYLRPEIPGFVLGAFILALVTKKWQPSRATSPLLRFVIAFFVMLGCLVFLGCPLRMALRLGAGDLNAFIGLIGFVAGIFAGSGWIKSGFTLGTPEPCPKGRGIGIGNGLVIPVLAIVLLLFLFARPAFIRFSESGPGSMHAPVILALVTALIIGALCVQSGFCITGGIRDILLIKNGWGFIGYVLIIVAALAGSLMTGRFRFGFEGQPIAHTDAMWNFLSMALVGYGSALIGGCPLRQMIRAGHGSADGGIALLAFITAGATAHNFKIAASTEGVPPNGKIAVIIGLVLLTGIALLCRKPADSKAA